MVDSNINFRKEFYLDLCSARSGMGLRTIQFFRLFHGLSLSTIYGSSGNRPLWSVGQSLRPCTTGSLFVSPPGVGSIRDK